jgi:hypothetical protein
MTKSDQDLRARSTSRPGSSVRILLVPLATLIAAALLGTQGCMAYGPSPARLPVPTDIRVRFAEPRPLAIARTGAPTEHVSAASELEGRMFRTRGDTLYLEPTRVVAAERELPGLTLGAWTAIVLREGDRLETFRFSPRRFALGFVTALVVSWIIFGLAYDPQ